MDQDGFGDASAVAGLLAAETDRFQAGVVQCQKYGWANASQAVFEALVDLREASDTYLGWFGVRLEALDQRQLYVPEGCAHGYQALEDGTVLTGRSFAAQGTREAKSVKQAKGERERPSARSAGHSPARSERRRGAAARSLSSTTR